MSSPRSFNCRVADITGLLSCSAVIIPPPSQLFYVRGLQQIIVCRLVLAEVLTSELPDTTLWHMALRGIDPPAFCCWSRTDSAHRTMTKCVITHEY